MRKGFLISEEMRKYFPIYEEAVSHIWLCNCSTLNFPVYEENFIFFFISVSCFPVHIYIPSDLLDIIFWAPTQSHCSISTILQPALCSYENVSLLFCISDFVKIFHSFLYSTLFTCVSHLLRLFFSIYTVFLYTPLCTCLSPLFMYFVTLCTYFSLLFWIMYFFTLCTCLSLLFLYPSLWTYLSLHFVHIYSYFSVSFTYVSLLLCILEYTGKQEEKGQVCLVRFNTLNQD